MGKCVYFDFPTCCARNATSQSFATSAAEDVAQWLLLLGLEGSNDLRAFRKGRIIVAA